MALENRIPGRPPTRPHPRPLATGPVTGTSRPPARPQRVLSWGHPAVLVASGRREPYPMPPPADVHRGKPRIRIPITRPPTRPHPRPLATGPVTGTSHGARPCAPWEPYPAPPVASRQMQDPSVSSHPIAPSRARESRGKPSVRGTPSGRGRRRSRLVAPSPVLSSRRGSRGGVSKCPLAWSPCRVRAAPHKLAISPRRYRLILRLRYSRNVKNSHPVRPTLSADEPPARGWCVIRVSPIR